jgi:hypothetical protein
MGPPLYMRFIIDWNVIMCRIAVSLSAATKFLHLTKNFIQQSPYTSKGTAFNSVVIFFKNVFHLGWYSLTATDNILNTQWPSWQFSMNTVLEATFPCPVPHIECRAVLLAQMSHVWSRNVSTFFLTGNISSKTHTHTHTKMNSIYLQVRRDVHNAEDMMNWAI